MYYKLKPKTMKQKIGMAILCILLLANIATTYAATIDNDRPKKERIKGMSDEQKKARLEEIRIRVNEIKETDKSTLIKSERKAIKKELREMRKESRAERKGGVYLSIGAVIIIVLLLIILL